MRASQEFFSIALFVAATQMVVAASVGWATPARAQAESKDGAPVAREIVQPLPGTQERRLNAALLRLARNPRNGDALIEAGDAALAIGDLDAAAGFFGRALDLGGSDPRARLGLAEVYLRSERPLDALDLLEQLEAEGALERDHEARARLLGALGLAHDLLGDNAKARERYRAALALSEDEEIVRRLALSHAIAGDERAFETALAPLIARGDFAAFRARAFGLAILGHEAEARAIVQSMLPPDLAAQMIPYLAYMPRLTRAQQAAAANLGRFPKAARIGRDDPSLASYRANGAARSADPSGRLAPRGPALDRPASNRPAPNRPADAQALGALRDPRRRRPDGTGSALEEAFSGFKLPPEEKAPAGSSARAVDITAIEAPRETARSGNGEARSEKLPEKKVEPERFWVQIATGRDRQALRFDWRRFARRYPDLVDGLSPHVARWGESHRLLIGPLDSRAQASALAAKLRAKGADSFPYTSPKGEKITKIQ